MLNLRRKIRNYVWHEIGDGKSTNVWFDKWNKNGTLNEIIPFKNRYEARFDEQENVADLIVNGEWIWPQEWRHQFNSLNTIKVPVFPIVSLRAYSVAMMIIAHSYSQPCSKFLDTEDGPCTSTLKIFNLNIDMMDHKKGEHVGHWERLFVKIHARQFSQCWNLHSRWADKAQEGSEGRYDAGKSDV
ncbi:hypothetical protein Tco_0486736 [Tanacetum coccineum]